MNKIIFTIFALCLIGNSFLLEAQDCKRGPGFNREAFIAKRNAYITAKVGLTPEEAAEFIPLSNELHHKLFRVELDFRSQVSTIKKKKDLTEEDYKKIVEAGVEVRIKQAELEKEYYEHFKNILSYKKLYKYKVANDMFTKEFMKDKYRKQNEARSNGQHNRKNDKLK